MKQMLDYADIIIEAVLYLGFLWAAVLFCKKQLTVSKKKKWLFASLSFLGWLLLSLANRRYFMLHIFFRIWNHIFFLGMVLLFFQGEREKKCLAASLLMTVNTLVAHFFAALLSCLYLVFEHTIKKVPEPFLGEWETAAINVASFVMVILAVRWMTKHMGAVFYGKTRKWYFIVALPLLIMLTTFDVAVWGATNGIMVQSSGNRSLYFDQLVSHTEFGVLAALSMFAAGIYVFGMDRLYLEQKKSSQYQSQIAVYQMLQEQYSQSERLRHDMKNHVIALSGLFQEKEWEKMGEYLRHMEGSVRTDGGDLTGNKAVDAIFYQKQKQAERKNVVWDCDLQIPRELGMQEFDLCVLLGNLLDNALEACERQRNDECRFIRIQGNAVKKCFLLEVKNSMAQTETYKGGVTNKKNSREHGIGLLNVRDVVQRYHGAINVEAGQGVFVISILIPTKEAAHDVKQAV